MGGTAGIFLNKSFFTASPGKQAAILTQEFFHGISPQFTDEFLGGLTEWDGKGGQEGAAQHISGLFDTNCGH